MAVHEAYLGHGIFARFDGSTIKLWRIDKSISLTEVQWKTLQDFMNNSSLTWVPKDKCEESL